jgi:hypothetical protein
MDKRDDYQEPVNRSLINAELDFGRYRPRFRRSAPYWVTVAVFTVVALIILASLFL